MNDPDLIKAVKETCLSCEGVTGMASTLTNAAKGTLKAISGLDVGEKGIRSVREKDGITFDIYIKVRYGEQIPVLAWNIQKTVISRLSEMTDDHIKAVNIHVQGVEL